MIGTFKEKDRSAYTPRKEVKELTRKIQQDFQVGWDIQHRSFREFNDMSVIDRLNKDQDDFNVFEEAPSKDPDKAWRSTAVSPIARNKMISIAAHIMVSLMFPTANARNEDGESQEDAARVIQKMMQWNIDNSDYDMSMLFGIIASLNSPCAYTGVPYYEAMQKIREQLENGDVNVKDATDDILSGIHFDNIPVEEMLIANVRQFEHQKQRFVMRVEEIDYTTAEALYGEHRDFKFVDLGVKRVFSSKAGLFYDSYDEGLNPTSVQKVTYRNRTEDLEVCYVNGVYLGDEEDVENNPMVHRTCDNKPRYAEAKFGYEPISKQFYYYKSGVNKLSGEKKRIDKMHRFIEDGTYLDIIKPIFTTGGAQVNAGVLFPGAVTDFPKDTQITPYTTGPNLGAGYKFVEEQEKRASESTQDAIRGGGASGADTAYEASRIEYNAVIKEFGIFGRMVGNAVEKVGELLVDNILWHQTLGEVDETVDVGLRMKFRSYLLTNQAEDGRKVNEQIIFSDEYMGREMTDDDIKAESYKLMRKGGVKDSLRDLKTKIYIANPYLMRKMKYWLDVEPDQMLPRSMISEENRKLKAYSMMILDPNADQKAVSRDFLFEVFAKGRSDEYMAKAESLGITPQEMPNGKKTETPAGQKTPDTFLPVNIPGGLPVQ